jgi:SAM-dependent methyltransferase
MLRRLKQHVQHAVGRVLAPHLAAQTDEIERRAHRQLEAESAEGSVHTAAMAVDPILTDFNHTLHALRTIELHRLPVNGGTLLSAGCAGLWYFDWLDEAAGPFREHIGVELYAPRPDGLPANVRWIAQSASDMSDVTGGSVDVVFSGQNLEHLWIDDLAGFLMEAHRVLASNGVLVVDSPNRMITEALNWVHPEHTIELAPIEAVELLQTAGFEVTTLRGLWSCRDQRTGELLPLGASSVGEILERSASRASPDDAFVWWIEATRRSVEVDEHVLRAAVADLFDRHWMDRVNRVAFAAGLCDDSGDWTVAPGEIGVLYRTWGFPLFAGAVVARASHPGLHIRLLDAAGTEMAAGIDEVAFQLSSTAFGVQAELVASTPTDAPLAAIKVHVEQRSAR